MAIPTSSYPNFKSYFPEQYSSVSKDQLPEIKDQQFFDARDPKGIGTHEKYSSVSKPEIKDKQGTINDTDHRMSFFQALLAFFIDNNPNPLTLLAPFACSFIFVLPPVTVNPLVLGTIIALFAVGTIIFIVKKIYDFLNSPEYLLTKGTKKLTADLEQLRNMVEEDEEKLKELHQQPDNYYNQKKIRFYQDLIRKTENEIKTIELALKKVH